MFLRQDVGKAQISPIPFSSEPLNIGQRGRPQAKAFISFRVAWSIKVNKKTPTYTVRSKASPPSNSQPLNSGQRLQVNPPPHFVSLLVVFLGCYSVDIYFSPESSAEPVPSHVYSFQTCLNLECPSIEVGPEHGPVLRLVSCPKLKLSFELTPRATRRPWQRRPSSASSTAGSRTPSQTDSAASLRALPQRRAGARDRGKRDHS